jgi:hypothetical protein
MDARDTLGERTAILGGIGAVLFVSSVPLTVVWWIV